MNDTISVLSALELADILQAEDPPSKDQLDASANELRRLNDRVETLEAELRSSNADSLMDCEPAFRDTKTGGG